MNQHHERLISSCTAVTAVSALKKMAFLGSFGSKIRNVWHLPTKISWQPEVVGVAGASCFCLESYTHLDFFFISRVVTP